MRAAATFPPADGMMCGSDLRISTHGSATMTFTFFYDMSVAIENFIEQLVNSIVSFITSLADGLFVS
jgi:hypothetical protein